MEWVKTTAKTLPEAIDLALDNLGVDEAEAEIKVLEEPKTGLFGRTRGIARVEARVKPKPSRPKAERSRRDGDSGRNRNRKKSGSNKPKGDSTDKTPNADTARSSETEGGSGSGSGSNRNGSGRERSRTRSSGSNSGRGSKTSGAANASSDKKADNRSKSSSGPKKSREATVPSQDASVEEVSSHLEGFLSGLTEAFGFDSAVAVEVAEDDAIVGRVEDPIGLLVGPKGRTLDAVQELARISCQRAVPSSIRIRVDVGGYRQQRAEALGEFARSAADRAVSDGAEVALEPMSAADRKAVHDALNEDDRVETRSVGVDPRRKIIVVPVDTGTNDADGEEE